jgi:hypothetical protein
VARFGDIRKISFSICGFFYAYLNLQKRVNIWVLISIFSHAKQEECEERETSTWELGSG